MPRNEPFALTDTGNAERLVAAHGDDLHYAAGLGWFGWDGKRWRPDIDGEVMRRAKRTVRAIPDEADELDADARKALFKWAITSESGPRLREAVKLAENEQTIVVSVDQLDSDPWLLNAPNGTVDLRSGELREHRRDDLLTKITGARYDADAQSARWNEFRERVTGGDPELDAFLARAVGYSLTGHTSEEVLFFPHGPTATGKSSLLEALKAALGDYADVADFETFLKRRGDAGPRNDIARLAGKRLVVSIEVDEGKALAEGLLKLITGGDTVTARFLYREVFAFRPTFKLWLAANERPRVSADDAAMWRRIIQLPFTEVIPEGERDDRVKLELRTSPDVQAAILAWAVDGCLAWQRRGLDIPERVRDYTAEYRAENDPLRDWLTDSCLLSENTFTFTDELRNSYEKWATEAGEQPLAGRGFGSRLRARGCTPDKAPSGRRIWRGIALTNSGYGGIDPSKHAGSAEPTADSHNSHLLIHHEGVTETAAEPPEAAEKTHRSDDLFDANGDLKPTTKAAPSHPTEDEQAPDNDHATEPDSRVSESSRELSRKPAGSGREAVS